MKNFAHIMRSFSIAGYSVDEKGNIYTRKGARKAVRALPRGYLMVDLSVEDVSKTVLVHQVVYAWFFKTPAKNINHKNGVKTDNRPCNLEESTPKRQTAHAIKIGLMDSRGEMNTMAKLSATDVREIRKLLSQGISQAIIGNKFGVGSRCISKIKTGVRWKHL